MEAFLAKFLKAAANEEVWADDELGLEVATPFEVLLLTWDPRIGGAILDAEERVVVAGRGLEVRTEIE